MGFASGISSVSGTIAGISSSGELGVGLAGGTQQTLLSQSLSPPAKKPVFKIILISYWIASCVEMLIVAFSSGDLTNFLIGILLSPILLPLMCTDFCSPQISRVWLIPLILTTLIAAVAARANQRWNRAEYPTLLQRYNATWFCKRCGHKWLVNS